MGLPRGQVDKALPPKVVSLRGWGTNTGLLACCVVWTRRECPLRRYPSPLESETFMSIPGVLWMTCPGLGWRPLVEQSVQGILSPQKAYGERTGGWTVYGSNSAVSLETAFR